MVDEIVEPVRAQLIPGFRGPGWPARRHTGLRGCQCCDEAWVMQFDPGSGIEFMVGPVDQLPPAPADARVTLRRVGRGGEALAELAQGGEERLQARGRHLAGPRACGGVLAAEAEVMATPTTEQALELARAAPPGPRRPPPPWHGAVGILFGVGIGLTVHNSR
jgi:hypothetical protein